MATFEIDLILARYEERETRKAQVGTI
jgi:hypothetical protein